MEAMTRHPAVKILLLAVLLLVGSAPPLAAQNEPLLLVADLEYSGISDPQMKLLVDLLSYMIFENGAYTVMNRYERNKLLRGFGYSQTNLKDRSVYLEAAELLRARYIVTGSLRPGEGGLALSLTLWEVATGALVKTASFTAADFAALVEKSRGMIDDFLGRPAAGSADRAASGLSETLYVTRIRERILVALPAEPLDETTAAARLLVGEAAARLSRDERVSIFFTSAPYDPGLVDPSSFAATLAARDCHSLALIGKDERGYFLRLYQPDFTERMRLPLATGQDREKQAELLAENFGKTLPPFPPSLLARELDREIVIKEKLDRLLFNEKFLSRPFMVNLHTSVVSPALAGVFHPLLNIIPLGLDGYWYYGGVIGCGLGYSFALGYPATIDAKLAAHPLIAQHEFRLIPFSYRSAGPVSVVLNLITSLNIQNAYQIQFNSGTGVFDYLDETTLFSLKFALNMGMFFNVTDDLSVFIELATLCYFVPLNLGMVTNNGTNFSGAFGGLGVIVRF
jgi:hypothetical protein